MGIQLLKIPLEIDPLKLESFLTLQERKSLNHVPQAKDLAKTPRIGSAQAMAGGDPRGQASNRDSVTDVIDNGLGCYDSCASLGMKTWVSVGCGSRARMHGQDCTSDTWRHAGHWAG